MNLKYNLFLGNYIPDNSIIHRIDPRIKLLLLLSLLLILYLIRSPEIALIPFGFIILCLSGARIPLSSIIKSLLPFLWLFFLTVLFNLFFTYGESIAIIGPLSITLEGIKASALLILRLTIMILSALLFTFTTPQSGIIKAIEWLLNPFKKLGLPVSEFSLMASLSLRFIPILLEEAERIFKAQTSKGAYLGSFSRRVRALSFSLSPLFTNTFRRAEELTTAMIVRGYKL